MKQLVADRHPEDKAHNMSYTLCRSDYCRRLKLTQSVDMSSINMTLLKHIYIHTASPAPEYHQQIYENKVQQRVPTLYNRVGGVIGRIF